MVQPPPGLPQPVEMTTEPTLPTTTETDEEKKEETTATQPALPVQPAPQVRRRLTTKTMPKQNDLIATIDTGVLHLSTNEDPEEKKLSLDNMCLQEWYDDDNLDYDGNELKAAIKDEHTTHYRRQACSREYMPTTTVNNNSRTSYR
eukprot:3445967-Amphidinium_carterae.1